MTTTSVASDTYSSAILESLAATSTDDSTTSTAEEIYTTWIAILAAQLQNQDPTDPVDPSEFTSQLTSIASLEQQALTNETLTSLLTAVQGVEADSALAYLGAEITAYGDTAPLSGGTAEWEYSLPETADEVTLYVLDEDGNIVYSAEGSTSAGTHEFTWDGVTSDGETAADGAYQLVVEAVDSDGNEITPTLYAQGTITSVDTSTSPATLLMDGISVPTSYIVSMAVQ